MRGEGFCLLFRHTELCGLSGSSSLIYIGNVGEKLNGKVSPTASGDADGGGPFCPVCGLPRIANLYRGVHRRIAGYWWMEEVFVFFAWACSKKSGQRASGEQRDNVVQDCWGIVQGLDGFFVQTPKITGKYTLGKTAVILHRIWWTLEKQSKICKITCYQNWSIFVM